jgi:hypothetical protein
MPVSKGEISLAVPPSSNGIAMNIDSKPSVATFTARYNLSDLPSLRLERESVTYLDPQDMVR